MHGTQRQQFLQQWSIVHSGHCHNILGKMETTIKNEDDADTQTGGGSTDFACENVTAFTEDIDTLLLYFLNKKISGILNRTKFWLTAFTFKIQTRMNQKGDHMKMNFDNFQIQN